MQVINYVTVTRVTTMLRSTATTSHTSHVSTRKPMLCVSMRHDVSANGTLTQMQMHSHTHTTPSANISAETQYVTKDEGNHATLNT